MSRLDRSLLAGAAVLALAPIIAAAVSVAGREWYPASDVAIQLLQIDDAGGPYTPLTGAHSRYGWDHPGPLQSWLLAPFGWLFGVTGVLVGVALLNAAAVAGALVVARRRGGVTLTVLVASVLLVLTLANGTDLFINPWNPWVAVLPFFTYLLLAWSLADGDVVVLPWLVGVGTYIVQAHVSYAPLVLGAGLVAALMAWRAPRSAHGGGVRMPVLIALGTGVVLWLPPLVQQLFSDDGNLAAIIEFFRDPPEAQAGWRLAWGIMGTELGPPGAWLTGDELGAFGVLPSGTVPSVLLTAATVAAGLVASRRGSPSAGRLALLVAAACVLGVIATSRITGLIGTYLVRWWWVLAAVVWLSLAWSAMCLLRDRRAQRGVLAVVAVATVALSVVATARAVPAGLPDADPSVAVGALVGETVTELDRNTAYLVDWNDAEGWGAVGIGVFAELERRGFDVSVLPARAASFGKWRTARPEEVDATVLVIGSPDGRDYTVDVIAGSP